MWYSFQFWVFWRGVSCLWVLDGIVWCCVGLTVGFCYSGGFFFGFLVCWLFCLYIGFALFGLNLGLGIWFGYCLL